MSYESSALIITGRDIIPPSISRKQKTSVGLGDFYAGDKN